MVTATIDGDLLEFGSTSSDEFTLVGGIAANGPIDGNGGDDALILTAAGDEFAALGGAVTYDDATDTWSVGGSALTGGFDTVTFADGVVIEAGVASDGVLDPAAGAPDGTPLALVTLNDYDWDGAAGTVTPFTADGIVSVDGIDAATAGANFGDSANQGLFSITGGTNLAFTADTAAIAAQGNVDDTATFTFEVVVEDSTTGETRTVDVTYSTVITYTEGADTFQGTDAVDTEDALGGDDVVRGGGGDDVIESGSGDDSVFGEDGNDTITNAGGGNDFIRGGNGDDTIDGTGGLAGETQNLGGGNGADDITGGNSDDTVFGSGGDDVIMGTDGTNVLNGGGGDDTITAGATGDDVLRGGAGDDILNGDGGNSEMRGGAGADTVNGGAGNELIYTSLDGDTLTGGAGDDSFIIKSGIGATEITDFGTGNDELTFEGTTFTSLTDLLASAYETNAGVVIEIDADSSLTLTGAELGDLTAANTDFA